MSLIVPGLHLLALDCHVGAVSETPVTVGAGTRAFTLTQDSPRLVRGMDVTVRRLGDADTWMRGTVASRPWEPVRLIVTASAGTGTHDDWLFADGVLRWSTGERGYWSHPADDPPQAFWDGRLLQPALIRYDLFGRGTTYGQSRLEFGDVVLADADRAITALMDYDLSGRTLRLWRIGSDDLPFSAAVPLLVGQAASPTVAQDSVTLRLRGRGASFDVPCQPVLYAGDNAAPAGLEGTAQDLAGQRKPLVFGGTVREAPLPLVNAWRLIVQADSGPSDLLDLSDLGQPLTRGADYASAAEMDAVWPERGFWRVWQDDAGTYARLGATPAGAITGNVRRHPDIADQYPGAVMRAVVTGPGGLTAGEVDGAALDALDAVCPWPVAIWVEPEETIAAVLDRICLACGGWWAFTPLGVFTAGPLAIGPPVMTLRRLTPDVMADADTFDILDSEVQQVGDEDGGAPIHAVRVGHTRALFVQPDPAGSVTAERRAFLSSAWRYTPEAVDPLVLARNPGARLLTLETDQTSAEGAAALRDQQLALRRGRKRRLAISTILPPSRLAALCVGQTVHVIDPASGLWAGRDMIIISLAIDARRDAVTLGLWG